MNPHEQEGHAPAPRRGKRFPKLLFIPVAMMGMGYFVGGYFIKAAPKNTHDATHEEEYQPDPTIDDTIGEQRWKDALVKIRADLRTADTQQSIPLKFREGVCQERQGDYNAASLAFTEVIAAEPASVRGIAARISWARCQIKLNRLSDARAALARLMLLSGDDGKMASPLHSDLLATIAYAEYLSGATQGPPHPLNWYLPATTEKVADLEQLIIWAGPLPKPKPSKKHGSGHGDAHGHDTHSATDDHGHDAAKEDHGDGAAAHDDHGKKPVAHDDHGKTPAGHDDHASKPAANKAGHAEDDHGKKPKSEKPVGVKENDEKKPSSAKPAVKEDEHPKPAVPHDNDHSQVMHRDTSVIVFSDPEKVDDHGKKPAAPAKDAHADDHGKKPAAPAKNSPEDAHGQKQPVGKAGSAKENAAKPKREIRIKPAEKGGEWLLSVDIQSRGMRTVVESLAREMGLQLKLTGIADELLSGKAANILVVDMPASQIFDSLLHPAELEWKIAELELIVSPLNKAESAWRERARRAIERFLDNETDHVWKTSLTIDLGNLEFIAKNWKDAYDTYVRALDEGGLKPEAVAANYNLGLTCVHMNLRDKAREQFQNLVDRDTSSKWGAIAYWWAGRTHLDMDEPDKAIRYFDAALDSGETGPAISCASLGLAFCYLMKNDYESAIKSIRPYKEQLKQSDYRQTAAYVDALCRFKRAENPRVTGEADEILYAVLNVTEDLVVGPAGSYQLGKTCRELGFGPRMAVLYSRTLESLRGMLAIRMTRELADYQYAEGDPDKAFEGYKGVAAVDRGDAGRHARLQLARLSLQQKNSDDAMQYCLDALRVGADRDAILKEMGRAYEMKRDYVKAAKCFAGEFP